MKIIPLILLSLLSLWSAGMVIIIADEMSSLKILEQVIPTSKYIELVIHILISLFTYYKVYKAETAEV